MAGKIIKRLDDMKAAENLEVLFTLPGNHHPLKGDKKGQFACYLEHPYRLVYEPGNEPLPINENNELISIFVKSVETAQRNDAEERNK